MCFKQTNGSTTTNRLGRAAQRDLVPLVSVIYESLTRNWLQAILQNQREARGLHWKCGSGEDTFLIASLLGEQNTIRGLDADPVLIERAREAQARKEWKHIEFAVESLESWQEEKTYDFVFTRFWASELANSGPTLQAIYQHLIPGGSLLVEVVQLAGYRAYPYHHAFARAVELIGSLEQDSAGAGEQLLELLQQVGFVDIETSNTHSAFIPQSCNHIVTLALESFEEEVLRQKNRPKEELEALLFELRHNELQKDTMISRPGVHQVSARKKAS